MLVADVLGGKMYKGNTVFTTKPDNTLSGCLFSYESFGFCQEKAQDFSYMHDPCRYIPHNRSNVDHMPPLLLCGRPIQNL